MKASFSIFVVLAVGVAIVAAEYDSLCEYEKTGTVVPHPTDCRLFIHCKKGKGIVEHCNQDGKTEMYFDEKLSICHSKNSASCKAYPKEPKIPESILDKCENLHEGALLADSKNCDDFYVCQNTWAYVGVCPSGMHFSVETESCGSPLAAGCRNLDSMCHGEPMGFKFAALTCEHYYKCTLLGYPVLQKCPNGLYYGMVAGKCVNPSESECYMTTTTPKTTTKKTTTPKTTTKKTTTPKTTTSETPSTHPNVECALHKHGETISDPKDSSKFYICTEHGAIHMDCPSDLVYSKKDGFCEVSKRKEFIN